jgi:hypothetical protein
MIPVRDYAERVVQRDLIPCPTIPEVYCPALVPDG